jgi:2-oxoglutarate ferredoxin oxidoreductase subunit alpha
VSIPLKDMAKAIPDGRANMIALGIAAKLLGLSQDVCASLLAKRLADRGQGAVDASQACLKAGYDVARDIDLGVAPAVPPPPGAARR